MKSTPIEQRKSNTLAKPKFLCAYENNLALSNWYKEFKHYLTNEGYKIRDLDVNHLLFQSNVNELPVFKIVFVKMKAADETHYLLLPMNNGKDEDYARYRHYCQYLLEFSRSYYLHTDLILIFNTKRAQFLHNDDFIPSNKLKVLSTSLDVHSINLLT